ncbi:MAG: exodeoxyribonuclease V subunit gamma [Verrucomicrobiae bacterium]|nr:exodeoxyribonuclease V subunit gamma [Verrucomicrobiae bacterium]
MGSEIEIVCSNRLEDLAERLAAAMSSPRQGDPMAPEILVVQSRGMARWLQLELARRLGVCARIRFPFPKAFLRELALLVVPECRPDPRFEPDALTWRVWDALVCLRDRPEFAAPERYAGPDPLRRFQLARRVAGLFDQYLVYRPDLIAGWDSGRDPDWQPALWREVRGPEDGWPESRWLQATAEGLRGGVPPGLPGRVFLFGIAALPPAYLQVLAALAHRVPVILHTLQPTREYWGDLVSPHAAGRELRRAGAGPATADGLHLQTSPRLLVSLGRQSQAFHRQLTDLGAGGGDEPFTDPGDDTLLHALQSDLIHLRAPDPLASSRAIHPADASIRIHACHSPRRELEVLYDQILDAMDRDPALEPRDVLVLTPDIEAYAPLIHAVLGAPESESRRLPYTVADREPRAQSPLVGTFLRLLHLPDGRCGRSEIEPLLEVAAVQRRLGWSPENLARWQQWLVALGTGWGLDAGHRRRLGLPALPQGTWSHARDRLLLGMAMADGDEAVIAGVSPFPGVEGDGVDTVAGVALLVGALERGLELRDRMLPLSGWERELMHLFDAFLLPDAAELEDARWIRETLSRLSRVAAEAGVTSEVPFAAVRDQLQVWLAEEGSAGGFLRGGITFAALKPLRSIPARFLAVLGLNDAAFPRRPVPAEFDRIAADPRPGDEAREADDRHLFLETLLSARDRLHLSYLGQSPNDNTPIPPSVVVSEVLDHLADRVEGGAGRVTDAIVVRHPLQAFSRVYFTSDADPRLFSYSAENARAAAAAQQPAPEPPMARSAASDGLPPREAVTDVVELDALVRFLKNPARHFLEQRLGLRLPRAGSVVEDRERFILDGLAGFQLKQQWLDRLQAGGASQALQARQLANGDLPLGPAGPMTARELEAVAGKLFAVLPPEERQPLPPVPIGIPIGNVRLQGRIGGLTPVGPLTLKPAAFKAADLLELWVRLLALAAHGWQDGMFRGRLIACHQEDPELHQLSVPSDPIERLTDLLALYAIGDRRPLPFFPRAAGELTRPQGSQTRSSGPDRALQAWTGGENGGASGESSDAHFDWCFGHLQPHPLDDEFATLAARVFEPIWARWEKRKS